MIKFIFLLCLAVAAVAADFDEELHEQVIRIGSVGIKFADFHGYLVRHPEFVQIPTFEFRVVKHVIKEKDLLTFRCNILTNFYLAHETTHNPVLLCRDFNSQRVITNGNMVFLFSAENLPVSLGVSEIDLMLEKSLWTSLVSSSDVYKLTHKTGTDKFISTVDTERFKSQHGDPVHTVHKGSRQFGGGGFSGSGAQAGASSFGSGSGGGFPGGFGGGMSGSQAQAGASSFGSGGGFFG